VPAERSCRDEHHIDQHAYGSPNPTTGAALYLLGKVAPGLDLFREIGGDREDSPVPNDGTEIHMTEDAHFHSGAPVVQTFHIIVNAEAKDVHDRVLDFAQVVNLAFPGAPIDPNTVYTVTFKKAVGPVHQGSLLPGATVEIKNGTIFHVTQTTKS
jgi:hypothetical protein